MRLAALALLVSAAGCGAAIEAGSTGTGGSSGSGGSTGAGGQSGGMKNPLTQDVIDGFVAAHNAARSGPLNPTPSPALPPVS